MPNLSLHYSPLFLLLFAILSISASFFFYRNTPINSIKKAFLISLKSLSFFLILFVFVQPVLNSFSSLNKRDSNILLIDNSRSCRITTDTVKQSLILSGINSLTTGIYTFANGENGFQKFNSNIEYKGFETDLSSALEDIKKLNPDRNYNSIIILSDGNINSGLNPVSTAKTFQCPFVTICSGDSVQKQDLVLDRVYYNEISLTNTINRFKISVRNYLNKKDNFRISFLREGSAISTQTIIPNGRQIIDDITFEIRESNPGFVKYRFVIEPEPGEITMKNNYSDILVKYLDNKVKVLFISSGPGYDNAVFTDIIKRLSEFRITVKTTKTNSDFYEGPIDFNSINDLSCIFLLGFPGKQFNSSIISQLNSKVKDNKIPVIFFSEKNTDYQLLSMFDESVPFTSGGQSGESSISLRTISSPENTPHLSLDGSPSIFKNLSSIIQKPGSVVLAADRQTGQPIFITRQAPSISTAFLGYGLWKWNLNQQSSYKKQLEELIINSINISLNKERKVKFKIYPEKNFFDYTESIRLKAEVFDEQFNPVSTAKVSLKIYNGNIVIKDRTDMIYENGKYSLRLDNPGTGDYRIEGEAELNNNLYDKSDSRFIVDTLNNEFKETKSNYSAMFEIANNTGGRFFPVESNTDSIFKYINSIKYKQNEVKLSYIRFNLWENKYYLFLIILLLAIEWVIRKRNNIA